LPKPLGDSNGQQKVPSAGATTSQTLYLVHLRGPRDMVTLTSLSESVTLSVEIAGEDVFRKRFGWFGMICALPVFATGDYVPPADDQ
jgi:hypothetical protein